MKFHQPDYQRFKKKGFFLFQTEQVNKTGKIGIEKF